MSTLPAVAISANPRPISSMPGVSAIIWWNSRLIPSGQPKNQATRVISYGTFASTATSTAMRPHRTAASGVVHAGAGRSLRPQETQALRLRRWYAIAVAAQSTPPTNRMIRLIRCQYRMSPTPPCAPGTPVKANTRIAGESATIAISV
ncbi:hypothetical protein [Kribbella sp. NPDC055071]